MKRLFGTDGVRGIANREPMTCETTLKLGRAAAHLFKDRTGRHRVVIGKDTRLSGYMLESALTSGICSMGVDVLLVGPIPTPAIAFLTRSFRADAGVVISGSHNPFEDNGIKFFSRDGFKLPDLIERKIEKLIFSGEIDSIRPTADDIGKAYRVDDADGRYVEFVKSSFPKGLTLEGMKVVVDCANGATYKVTPTVLRELGADVIVLGDEPNGTNINLGCGSLYPAGLQNAVLAHKADVGFAHDGDGDRVVFCDEKGQIVDGDAILAACASELLKEGRLNEKKVVATVMSNLGFELAMKEMGIQVLRTPVGDRYVLEAMIREGCNLGGEQSGHIIFLDYNTTGDGLITALQVLALLQKKGEQCSDFMNCMTRYPQVLLNVKVRERHALEGIPSVRDKIRDIEKRLKGMGRVLVRYSGTESVVRVMMEGEQEESIRQMAEELAEEVQKSLG
ncbi:MAG TPA: phosphoglucosamine mutase [Nitrospiria bacterium]|jgi:phosphoglucosamine mutase